MTLDEHITCRVWLVGRARGLITGTVSNLLGRATVRHGLSHAALKNCLAGRSSWTCRRKGSPYAFEKVAKALHISPVLLFPTRSPVINLNRLYKLVPELFDGGWDAPNAGMRGAYVPRAVDRPALEREITLVDTLARLPGEQLADTIETLQVRDSGEDVVREIVRRLRGGEQLHGRVYAGQEGREAVKEEELDE